MAWSRTLTGVATPVRPDWWRAFRPLARVLAGLRTFRGGPRRLDPLELSEHVGELGAVEDAKVREGVSSDRARCRDQTQRA